MVVCLFFCGYCSSDPVQNKNICHICYLGKIDQIAILFEAVNQKDLKNEALIRPWHLVPFMHASLVDLISLFKHLTSLIRIIRSLTQEKPSRAWERGST